MSTNGSTVVEEQSRHVLRNNARRCLRRTTMVRITSDVNWTPGRANKVIGAGVETSYVHSSIIDQSLTTGIYPNKLKIAKVIPLFKKGDIILLYTFDNYRPIFLLPSISKIFERTMYDQN